MGKTALWLPFSIWPFSQDLYDLFPKQDVFLVHRAVVMEVSEEPVFIFQSPVYHLQKFREMVCLVVTVLRQGDAGGPPANLFAPAFSMRYGILHRRAAPPATRIGLVPGTCSCRCALGRSAGHGSSDLLDPGCHPPHRGSWPRP